MSPTSYRAAPPRIPKITLFLIDVKGALAGRKPFRNDRLAPRFQLLARIGLVMAWVSRRTFCSNAGQILATAAAFRCNSRVHAQGARGVHFSVAEFDRGRTIAGAEAAVKDGPVVLRQVSAPVKQHPQMFYSEKGGSGEDSSFDGHVDLLVAMNRALSALTAAWRLTGNASYFNAGVQQMDAWFCNPDTRMLPTLESAGVVPGVDDDRNSDLTGATALAESARAASFLCASTLLPPEKAAAVRAWFADLPALACGIEEGQHRSPDEDVASGVLDGACGRVLPLHTRRYAVSRMRTPLPGEPATANELRRKFPCGVARQQPLRHKHVHARVHGRGVAKACPPPLTAFGMRPCRMDAACTPR